MVYSSNETVYLDLRNLEFSVNNIKGYISEVPLVPVSLTLKELKMEHTIQNEKLIIKVYNDNHVDLSVKIYVSIWNNMGHVIKEYTYEGKVNAMHSLEINYPLDRDTYGYRIVLEYNARGVSYVIIKNGYNI
jgi:hypothetical protein